MNFKVVIFLKMHGSIQSFCYANVVFITVAFNSLGSNLYYSGFKSSFIAYLITHLKPMAQHNQKYKIAVEQAIQILKINFIIAIKTASFSSICKSKYHYPPIKRIFISPYLFQIEYPSSVRKLQFLNFFICTHIFGTNTCR